MAIGEVWLKNSNSLKGLLIPTSIVFRVVIITARCYAERVIATAIRPSVCLWRCCIVDIGHRMLEYFENNFMAD